jgi:hypothetical protein
MTLGVHTTTPINTGIRTEPSEAPPTNDTTADPNATVDAPADSPQEWNEFSDTQPAGLSGPPMMDLSASALTSAPEVAAGSDLGAISPNRALDPILEEARAAPGPTEVDAIIAREQPTLATVDGSLAGMSEQDRLATIGQLSELSELAGPEGQAALAAGVVGAVDFQEIGSENNYGIVRGLTNAVFEGKGATLAANVASDLMERPEVGAYDLGTQVTLGTTNAMSVLRTDLESATGEYDRALTAIGQQVQSEGLTGDAATARFRELATTPEMQALDSRLYWASEKYRSTVPGAQAALASAPITHSASQFAAGLVTESKLATDPTRLAHADEMRTAVGLSVLSGGGPQVGTIGLPPGIRPQLDPTTGEIVRFHPSFEVAFNQALAEVGPPGPDATPVYGKLGDLNGKFVGFQWDGGKKGFRIDWSPTAGGHINWWDYSAGTKRGAGARVGAEYFPGTKQEFDRRVQTYQRFDPAIRQQPALASSSSWNPVDKIAAITGLTGTALVIYLIVSEGSRLFPPRNLVPVP